MLSPIRDGFSQVRFLIVDLGRWKYSSPKDFFYYIFETGIWATILYRIGRMLFLINIPLLKYILRFAAYIIAKFSEICFGVTMPPGINIGPGLYIGHAGMIRIHPDVKIGTNLSIGHEVTIGTRGVGHKGAPTLGDNVYIGVGAKILGNIKVGSNVKIGANSVVITDLPNDVTVVGVPAKIVKYHDHKEE